MLTDKTYHCSKLYLTGNSRVLKRNNAKNIEIQTVYFILTEQIMVTSTQEIYTNLKKNTDYIEIPLVTTCIGISVLFTNIFNVTIFILWRFGLENIPLYVSSIVPSDETSKSVPCHSRQCVIEAPSSSQVFAKGAGQYIRLSWIFHPLHSENIFREHYAWIEDASGQRRRLSIQSE